MRTYIPRELDDLIKEVVKEQKLPEEIVRAIVYHYYKFTHKMIESATFGEFYTYDTNFVRGLGTFYPKNWKVRRLVEMRKKATARGMAEQAEFKLRKQEEFLRDD